jgi:hypothetical protein
MDEVRDEFDLGDVGWLAAPQCSAAEPKCLLRRVVQPPSGSCASFSAACHHGVPRQTHLLISGIAQPETDRGHRARDRSRTIVPDPDDQGPGRLLYRNPAASTPLTRQWPISHCVFHQGLQNQCRHEPIERIRADIHRGAQAGGVGPLPRAQRPPGAALRKTQRALHIVQPSHRALAHPV